MKQGLFRAMRMAVTFLPILLVGSVSGCGDGGHQSPSPAADERSVIVTITWPKPGISRLIPASAARIVLEVDAQGHKVVAKTISPPADGGTTTTTIDHLPAGALTLTATAYGSNNVAQARGSTKFTAQVQTPVKESITMDSTIHHFAFDPSDPIITVGHTAQLKTTALDASEAIVLLTPNKLQWKSLDESVATVAGSGDTCVITGVTAGSATIRVTDTESDQKGEVTVTVTWAGTYSGTFDGTFKDPPPSEIEKTHGTWNVTVDKDGHILGTGSDGDGSGSGEGQVDVAGNIKFGIAFGDETSATFTGKFVPSGTTVTVNGTYRSADTAGGQGGGTFTGSRNEIGGS